MRILLALLFSILSFTALGQTTQSSVDRSSIDPAKCVWEDQIPRRVLKAPSPCGSRYPVKSCLGYARCETPKGSFVVSVTCSASLCDPNSIQECMADEKFGMEPVSSNSEISTNVESALGLGASK